MLLVQTYLQTHSFAELAEEHGVYASFSKSGHKFSLNYDQLESKESDLLAQQCRGLILSAVDGKSYLPQSIEINERRTYDLVVPGATRVLAYPMNRFFNYGQGSAADVDWADPKLAILEKLDGTLTIVYYDMFTDEWCVATRSVPEADIIIDSGFYTFRSLFEKALKDTNGMSFEDFTERLDREITYCFELTTPYNRIVVDYKESRITLIAARTVIYGIPAARIDSLSSDMLSEWESFAEMDIDDVPTYGVPHVQAHTYTSVSDLLDWISNQNPLEHEGVVVRDSKFNRIKMKNASYVAFNRARDILGTSERNCLELVLAGKEDDVIPALPPEIVERILNIKAGVLALIKDYDMRYVEFKTAADRIKSSDKKTFAIMVTGYKGIWTAPMFSMFDGKSSDMRDFIMKNRKDGTWGDSFLDRILAIIK